MAEHITVNPAQLSALSRSYQQISTRIDGLSTIVAAAPGSADLTSALPGSRIVPAASTTCGKWSESLLAACTNIDVIAQTADALAVSALAHEHDQSAALEKPSWSR
ncbi:hypothetical protein ACOJA0_00515 [Corynebacterium amycolatum]|uniref:hypothetical protein n=1 Tax=Corynebacterium TaxID=1716 RepID=UPI0008A2915C|nr:MULTISPECIES: hypothetical protein [unclassified Corynebacterium]OFL74231.1 hypothetical protein HMPREF2752_07530 [Corynebacterium sp. HMSC077C02]